MIQQLGSYFRSSRRRWLYKFLSASIALTIILTNQAPTYSISWLELIFRGAQVIQLSNVSDAQEVELGKQINEKLVESGQITLYKNTQLNQYINNIGQRLVKNSDRPNIAYTFQIVNDRDINAFATMGGYVYLHTGLLTTAVNEAEVASVLAHEIGHIVRRHSIKQMRSAAINQGLLSVAGLDRSTVVQLGVELALNRPNSREDEFEADNSGLKTLQKTGYAPAGMLSFMDKLQKQGKSVPTFMSTHPATSDRIKSLKTKIDPNKANVGEGLNTQSYQSQIQILR